MPTYEYRCGSCGYDFETFQHFDDEPLKVCPKCGEQLHKVFNSVGIVFKGPGFYSTDNHSSHKAATPAKDSADAVKEPAPAKKTDKTSKESAAATPSASSQPASE